MPPTTRHNWLFSRQCLLCNLQPAHNGYLCTDCYRELPWLGVHCPGCALPLTLQEPQYCGQCQQTPPLWQHIHAACRYDFPLNELISHAKYQQALHYIPLLAEILLEHLPRTRGLPRLILPVPMSARKLRQRQVNHAWLLARQLGQTLGIPVCDQRLQKVRDTGQQKDLSRAVRLRNLHGSFAVTGPLPDHVAVVDDVMTTGSTLTEIARLLRRHGVQQVSGWVVARTPPARHRQ